MRLVVLIALLLISGAVRAASFDCQKAATPSERAICADSALSQLDEQSVAAYADATQTLGISDDERDPVGELLLRGHSEWSAARNRCGAATGCLMQQYLRRVAVLGYKPDPQVPSPLDPLVGRYGTPVEPARELVVMAAPGNVVLVNLRVTSADWTCVFTGIGKSDGKGGLLVTRADFDGTTQGPHRLHLTPTRLGLAAERADPADDISARFCGAGGTLEQPFPRH
jgi:uncharacterized protein